MRPHRAEVDIEIGFLRLPIGEARDKTFSVRMSRREVRALEEASRRAGAISATEYARKKLLGDLTLPA